MGEADNLYTSESVGDEGKPFNSPRNILAIGAHPDDIEISSFGSLALLKKQGYKLYYLILSMGEDGGDAGERIKEANESAGLLDADLTMKHIPSAHLGDNSGRKAISAIEEAIKKVNPQIIFTHTKNDYHQDHRSVNEATLSAIRFWTGKLYFYENSGCIRYFQPNVFVDITPVFDRKLEAIKLHKTQMEKTYMQESSLIIRAEFRALQAGYMGKAEAFELEYSFLNKMEGC